MLGTQPERLLTFDAVCLALGVSRPKLLEAMKDGRITPVHILGEPRLRRFRARDVQAVIDEAAKAAGLPVDEPQAVER